MATQGTWQSTESYVVPQAIGETSTVQLNPLGLVIQARDIKSLTQYGNATFIYLKGVSSTIVGSVVTYDNNSQTALIVGDAVGPVAVAMSINVAGPNYGWYQRSGIAYMASETTVVADELLFIGATAGKVDDAVVAGDAILTATSLTAASGGFLDGYMNFPAVTDVIA